MPQIVPEMWIGFVARGGILMIPIVLCSIIGLALILERAYTYRRLRLRDFSVPEEVRLLMAQGSRDAALAILEASDTAGASLMAQALRQAEEKGTEALEVSLDQEGERLINRMEVSLRGLATVAGVSPLLGLLGTVVGMIKSFMQIELHGGNVSASLLAGGIWEALLTTAAGLSVAIPCLLFHNLFQARVDRVEMALSGLRKELKDVAA
jgi:biopolymer transport protein ExbB